MGSPSRGRLEINPEPTRYPELNALLRELTLRTAGILDESFVGAYLQGSFAVGDADMHSDCDFLIPVSSPITLAQEKALRALHDEIPTREGHWTKHLEGSYPNLEELRTLGGLGSQWLYIDHGWREMQWSTHCNSEVVRWSLRECGVTLTGPDPRTLVEEIPAEAMRARARSDIESLMDDLKTWLSFEHAWAQRYTATTYCRILYTFETGRVNSKKAALEWAIDRFDTEWTPLFRQVLADRELADAGIASPLITSNGVLAESCDFGSGVCDDNQKQFKGIFMKHLSALASYTGSSTYQQFAQRQSDAIWASDRDSMNRLGQRWTGTTPNPKDWRTQASALGGLIAP